MSQRPPHPGRDGTPPPLGATARSYGCAPAARIRCSGSPQHCGRPRAADVGIDVGCSGAELVTEDVGAGVGGHLVNLSGGDSLAIARARRERGESLTAIARHLRVGRPTLYRALDLEHEAAASHGAEGTAE
jgi:hypothetical protein